MATGSTKSGRRPARSAAARGEADRDAGLDLITKVNAVLSILERRGETSAAEIADLTGEPLSSVYRLLQSLVGIGWIDRGWRRGSYRLGLLILTVGSQLEEQLDIRECALPTLRRLNAATSLTTFLCVRRQARAVCVERVEGEAVRSLAMQLGGSLPLFVGGAPRALLAFLPHHEQEAVLRVDAPQPGDPPRPGPSAIAADIARVRGLGYALSDEDVTPGIASLGAPVFNHRGEVVAAISLGGLRAQVLGERQSRHADLIVAGAADASRALGLAEAAS